ncbi:hypothetical protein DPMN_147307 [Dreissena polymorpha]|uniref:Uncharacterized protein n=1 Tax=Dreissena polymorpha TaxID=45954 RepID=A0A9D4F9M7_DREPO|nr:hypothetical protein DPMN_147307 [Dreissena polymorpha]
MQFEINLLNPKAKASPSRRKATIRKPPTLPNFLRAGSENRTQVAYVKSERANHCAHSRTASHRQIEMTLRGTSAGGSANPAESATLEPDVFFTARFAVSSKMQRSSQPLIIDEANLYARVKEDSVAFTLSLPEEGQEQQDSELTSVEEYGADLGLGSFLNIEGYAQRNGETVPGIEETAGDGRSGHKGGAAREEKKGASLIEGGGRTCK